MTEENNPVGRPPADNKPHVDEPFVDSTGGQLKCNRLLPVLTVCSVITVWAGMVRIELYGNNRTR